MPVKYLSYSSQIQSIAVISKSAPLSPPGLSLRERSNVDYRLPRVEEREAVDFPDAAVGVDEMDAGRVIELAVGHRLRPLAVGGEHRRDRFVRIAQELPPGGISAQGGCVTSEGRPGVSRTTPPHR